MDFGPAQVSIEQVHFFVRLGHGKRQINSHRGFSIPDIWAGDQDGLQALTRFNRFVLKARNGSVNG
jgi:hypothetical protein